MNVTTYRISLATLSNSLDNDGAVASVNTRSANRVTAQCSIVDGTAYGGGIVTIEGSIDGITTWFSLGTTFSADGISSALDVTQYAIVRARVSTIGTGTVAVSFLPKIV